MGVAWCCDRLRTDSQGVRVPSPPHATVSQVPAFRCSGLGPAARVAGVGLSGGEGSGLRRGAAGDSVDAAGSAALLLGGERGAMWVWLAAVPRAAGWCDELVRPLG